VDANGRALGRNSREINHEKVFYFADKRLFFSGLEDPEEHWTSTGLLSIPSK